MAKTVDKMTFDELVEYVALELHSALLVGGGKEFKSRLYTLLSFVILREQERQKKGDNSG